MAKKIKRKKINSKAIIIYLAFAVILLMIFANFDKITSFALEFQSTKTKVEVKEIPENNSILDAIVHAKNLLGISEKNYRNWINSDIVNISMGINSSEMDLNYANMILTGQIELLNGNITIGKEIYNGNRQQLTVIDPDDSQKYVVTLYYAETKSKIKKIKIAIIVDDFGIHNGEILDAFCKLDKNVTFAILPNQRYSELVMNKAHKFGHETMIHMPMEPISYPRNNPGANAIYVHLSEKEIRHRMNGYIKNLPLCVGANNHMGSMVTTDENVMRIVLSVLKENNLFFVDSRTSQSSIAYKKAKEMQVPAFESSLFLDTPTISESIMKKKLSQIKALAKYQDKILVITHCATWERYKYLKSFLEELKKNNYEIVPVSDLLKRNIPDII